MAAIKLPDHAVRWNELAGKHDLSIVGRFLAKERAEQIAYYQTLTEDFWRDLDEALGRRGAWAKKRRFPNFVQMMDETIAAKLFEGFYEDDENPEKERDTLIEDVVRRRSGWRLPNGGVIEVEGIDGPRGLERWATISTERIENLIEGDDP